MLIWYGASKDNVNWTFRIVAATVGTVILLMPSPSLSSRAIADEYEVKAAYILNFAKLVSWPRSAFASDSAPIIIGIVGNDPFGSVIDRVMAGKTAGGRTLSVKRIPINSAMKGAHILFVSMSAKDRIPQVLEAVSGSPVLTIGDRDGFASRGGVMDFYWDDGSVKFTINRSAAARQKLEISSRLLSLARLIN